MKKKNLNTTLSVREAKRHNELNCTFSIDFFNQTYNLTSKIKNDNRLKYLQFSMINLFTNYRVNKFINDAPLLYFLLWTPNFGTLFGKNTPPIL